MGFVEKVLYPIFPRCMSTVLAFVLMTAFTLSMAGAVAKLMAMILRSIGTWVKVGPSLHRPEWDHEFPLAVEAKMKYFNAEALPNVVKAMVNLYYMHTLPTLLQSAEEKIKIKKYKYGLQEVRCDWMHAFSGALGEL